MSWWKRLTSGLQKSSDKLTDGMKKIFTHRKLDAAMLDELEDLLITADLGPIMAARMVAELSRTRMGQDVTLEEVQEVLANHIAPILEHAVQPIAIDETAKPYVILVVGVNGVGKTTTIGKLAKQWTDQGKKVVLAAGDTFRAAAVEQLKVWAERSNCELISKDNGSDSAALAFESLESATASGADILIIDTAGRLHNKSDLMAELQKIVRVLKKKNIDTPHATLLILDATTGQDAIAQVEAFRDMVNITGLIATKLDGSAKAGVLVPVAERFKLPIHAIGVGETSGDLQVFEALSFSRALLGLPDSDSMAA